MAQAKKRSRTAAYESLHDLLILKLRSLLDIETEITKALPKLAKAAQDEKLREALTSHLEETKGQAERLTQALELLRDTAQRKSKVEAIRGLAKDAAWIVKSIKSPAARDALIIAAAQYVELYEIAGYGTAAAWADQMGHEKVSALLRETLEEEGAANKKLNAIALDRVNSAVPTEMSEG